MTYIAGNKTTVAVTIASAKAVLGQLVDVTPPKMSRGEIDTSHLGSTWKERIATLPDGGDVEFTLEWEPKDTNHQYLWTSFQAGAIESWEITLSDLGATATKIDFSGFLKEFPWDQITNESVVKVKFTIAISGAITITPAT